jgi:hypothetical protein
MQAEIYDRFSHLAATEAGQEAVAAYVDAIETGKSQAEAEVIGSNVLERAGFGVNRAGGASFRVAHIDHNEQEGVRVSLVVDSDDNGFFVATTDGDDTGPRFPTALAAYDSIWSRWGQGWDLQFAGA